MKFCPNCGNKLQPGDQFCENCGYKLTSNPKPSVAEQTNVKKEAAPSTPKKREDVKKGAVNAHQEESAKTPGKTTNKTIKQAKKKFNQVSHKFNGSKLKETIIKNPKKYGIIGGVTLVALILVCILVHNIEIQPQHALQGKPYDMTINTKTTSDGFFTTHTESNTTSYVIYLNKWKKEAYSAKNLEEVKQMSKDGDSGTSYTITNDSLKIAGSGEGDDVQINNIHRSGDSYVGTLQPTSSDGTKISGTVTFHKAS